MFTNFNLQVTYSRSMTSTRTSSIQLCLVLLHILRLLPTVVVSSTCIVQMSCFWSARAYPSRHVNSATVFGIFDAVFAIQHLLYGTYFLEQYVEAIHWQYCPSVHQKLYLLTVRWVHRAVRGPLDDNAGGRWSAIQIQTSRHHHRHLGTVRRWRRPSDVTAGRTVRHTRCAGVTGAGVRRTTTPCVVPAAVSVTTSVSATTTDSSSAQVSAPTTSVFLAD